LAQEGYDVALLARGSERLDDAEAELREMGVRAAAHVCDVTDAAKLAETARRIEDEMGPVRVWVNSAMLTAFSRFEDMSAEEFGRIVETTLIGAVNGTRAALELMRPRNGGRIVNVSSGLAYRSVPLQSAYCAAKHGLRGFCTSLRSELIADGGAITVSMVNLPAINTPQFDWARNRMDMKPMPAPPIYAPEAAARAVMRVVDSGEREVFVGKSVIQLFLGETFGADFLDHKLAEDGVKAQRSEEPEPGGRPDNLDGPAPLDAAATGRFADRAKDKAVVVGSKLLRAVPLASGVAAGVVLTLALNAVF
jgi:NAD(P)-dependent dehydrogenase (short-subunit alcohol dehydrogenase family)